MLINSTALRTLFTGFNAAYQRGITQAAPQYTRVATTVPSATRSNEYGWLGTLPSVREWLGDRVVHQLEAHDYTIKNKPWELTVEVDRDDIEDDNVGIYGPLFEELGRSTAAHPDQLVWQLLKDGFATACYDGQYFFDTDHPVLDENGAETSVANTDGGSGTNWFLMDVSRALRPIIFQSRRDWQLVRKDRPEDDNVFDRKKYVYGSDARHNVGYGFWQFAWGSKQTLDQAHYETARAALAGMKADHGRPIGLMPNLLVVPPALEGEGRELLMAERNAAGQTNVWRNSAELLVVPWLG